MKIVTIFVRHGTEKYAEAEAALNGILARQLPDAARDLVVVDTALDPAVVEKVNGRALLGSRNEHREFEGFDRAIQWLAPRLDAYDLVHFTTSAFNQLYTAYIERFTTGLLRAAAARSVAVGHIDCYNDPIRVGSFVSQHWLRTCFFFVRPAQVRTLGSFVSVRDRSAFFTGDPASPFRPDAPLSDNYQRYIIDWLTGQDIGQGVSWHSRISLTPESLDVFEVKALSILNEQLASARLRALGCPLIDVTWLSSIGSKMPFENVDWRTPWQTQLADRDRDSIRFVP